MNIKRYIGRLRRQERAAALVEFGLVLPFLIGMMCLIIDFGLALHTLNNLTSAVREGARFAAVKRPMPGADDADVIARVRHYMNIPVELIDVETTTHLGVINVKVTVTGLTYTPVTPVAPLFGYESISFTRSAIYRYEFQ